MYRAPSLFPIALALTLAFARTGTAENKYDVLARTLQPFAALFYTKSATKAFTAEIIIRQAPGAPTAVLNQVIRIYFYLPDKLRVETTDPQRHYVISRNGQNVWVSPKALGDKIVASSGTAENSDTKIPDFNLPIKDQQIALLPALFQVSRFAATTGEDSKPAWLLEFRIDPSLPFGSKNSNWAVETRVDQESCRLEHVRAGNRKWVGEIEVLDTKFVASLPDATWEPDASVQNNTTIIPPALYQSAIEKLTNPNFIP